MLNSIRSLQEIVARVREETEAEVKAAYERGVAEGKRQAAEELRARVAGVFNLSLSEAAHAAGTIEAEVIHGGAAQLVAEGRLHASARAPRGSVEPKILAALKGSIKGKKPAEIAGETGVPENSVRGVLNKMRKPDDGRVTKRGEVWFSTEKMALPDGGSIQHALDGHDIEIPPPGTRWSENPGAGGAGEA